MIYYADIKENLIDGYYCKEIHEIIPEKCNTIKWGSLHGNIY